ncbi:MAG TPA: glycine--tRNA ligase subunit beta [Candidatus Limnocylindrales bacterium]|nr:glycine--tRNA ligase subunit beta [Candidatus Limnocylindrales bacterium]
MITTGDLLLEIGCEEIPSRFLEGAMEQLKQGATSIFNEHRLKFGKIETWGTPRRLVILVTELESGQSDLVEKIKGPPVNRAYDDEGNPTKALQGFLQSQGISLEQVEEELFRGSRYVVASKEISGQPTTKLLPELLPRLIQKLTFPRPMYWQSKDVRFARPIRWLLALYRNIPVSFSYAGIKSGNETYGHRFLAPGPFVINSVESYFLCMEKSCVVVDQNQRRAMIRAQLAEKAAENGGKALIDHDLLEEVIYLVEYPVAVIGYFDQAYLDLPQEVLVTTMQHHQRYFPITELESSKLLPFFIGISNNRFHSNISKGYAKVIQARLADGRFFFKEDLKKPLESFVESLQNVIFLEPLGSLDQKRLRIIELTAVLGKALALPSEKIENARRVAHLCKADLVTSMVKEFPELQGVMGREYARLSGESAEVSEGIYEHYLPRFGGDQLPSALEGALVSLADRIDTLAGCFAIGIQPTGSQDPFGLRRQAQGAVAILLDLELSLALENYIEQALVLVAPSLNLDLEHRHKIELSLHDFLIQRIRFVFQDRGISHDVIEAVLAVPFSAVTELYRRAVMIEENLKKPLLEDVIIAYNRVANLAQKSVGGLVDEALFESAAEKEVYSSLLEAETSLESLTDPKCALQQLQSLKDPIDNLFDHVMVMADDEKLRVNRINLLASLKKVFNRLADFSKIQIT